MCTIAIGSIYAAAELIKELVNYKEIQDTILNELVRLLKPSVENTGASSGDFFACTVVF